MKPIYIICVFMLLALCQSCNKYNPTPPLKDKFNNVIIVPESQDLTIQDREWLDEIEEEWENSINVMNNLWKN